MSKFTDIAGKLADKAKDGTEQLAKGAVQFAKNASDNINEKKVIKQADKKRANARNTALLALSDAAKDLEAYNKNLPASDAVKSATDLVIQEVERLKDLINQMTPATVVPILEEQKDKWLDDKSIESEADNYAQQELDKSEILKRRKMAVKQCTKAIEVLQKQADEEEADCE